MNAEPRAPADPVTIADVRSGRVAERHAQKATPHGSVFEDRVPIGWMTGPCFVVVGNDALALATGEARGALSSAEGWSMVLGNRFGRAVVNADDPEHTQDRRRWSPAFASAELERHLVTVRALIDTRTERWAAAPSFDAYAASRELAFAAIATTLGGFADDATLARIFTLFSQVLAPQDPDETEADRHIRAAPLRDELEPLLREHIALTAATKDTGSSLIAHLRRQDPNYGDDALLAHLNLLLVTGLEPTASLLTFALHYIAEPRHVAWLRDELEGDAMPGDGPSATLDALPHLDAFMRETGRMNAPALCAPRVALRDVEIGGVRVPARAHLALSYGGTNLLASSYEDPLAFLPQRWAAAATPRAATFGRGHRTCLG